MDKKAKKKLTTFSLPNLFRRHSIVKGLLRTGIIAPEQLILFNENSIVYLNLNDPEPRNVFLKSSFDSDFFSMASSFIPPKGDFFDIGANYGLCTFGLLPKLNSVRFHLFEANESIVRMIEKSTTLYENSFSVNYACISDKIGYSKFHFEPTQSGQSHIATDQEDGVQIKNLVLDQYCKSNQINRIDFAKIDLEGHELSALKGWQKCIKNHMVKSIYIEIMPVNQRRYCLKTNDPLFFLESHGYELFLCKEQDFGHFGQRPFFKNTGIDEVKLSFFKAEEYPPDFSTDVLALSPN